MINFFSHFLHKIITLGQKLAKIFFTDENEPDVEKRDVVHAPEAEKAGPEPQQADPRRQFPAHAARESASTLAPRHPRQ